MFTITDIQAAADEIKTGADFPEFARKLKALGITRSDVYVMNGMAIYFGTGDESVEAPPVYEHLLIDEQSSVDDLKAALALHQQGKTDYQTFCRQAAAAGVEKWVIDLVAMTVTYLGDAGTELLVEKIHN